MFTRASFDRIGILGCLAVLCLATLPAAADSFTQRFGGFSDLSLKSVRFSPDGSSDSYEACATDIDSLPVSTAGSNQVSLNSNGFLKITPGFSIEYYGVRYDELYIGANGYVTFTSGDVAADGTLANHFNLPRISGFYTDLNPSLGGTISWEVIGTKVVVTFKNVPLAVDSEAKVTFQIEVYSSGGVIVSWLELPSTSFLAGISAGNGTPGGFQDSDLSAYAACDSNCLNAVVSVADELADIYGSPPLNFPVDEMDLDVNGIPDVLNLRLLEETLRRGSTFGHCQALSAWEANLAILETKLAVLPNNFFTQWSREDFTLACAGMATLGGDRVPQNLVRLLGSTQSLGIGRDELDDSAEPFVSWSGDMDQDEVCNRGEFEASESFPEFLVAAFDPAISEDGGQCFREFFEFPDDEGEGTEEGDPDGPLCSLTMSSLEMVPVNNSPYIGSVSFTQFEDQVLVTVNHTVPQPASVTIFRGERGRTGTAFISLGSGPSPLIALISPSALDIISSGYYVQVSQSTNPGTVDIRGQIECEPVVEEGEGEGVVEGGIEGEGEGVVEGEGEGIVEGEGEGVVEGVIEGEGEGLEFEGEPEPFTSCLADMSGSLSVPPYVTNFGGVLVLTNFGDTAQLLVFHSITNPTFAALHLGEPGTLGPKLFDIEPPLASPIALDVPIEMVEQVTRGAYIRLGYSGFAPGEIRGDLTCELVDTEGEESPFHTADYLGPDGMIELTELLRVIQFFNLGGFGCGDEETGYVPGGLDQDCAPANFDYAPQNWQVDLTEILRIVQLYNARGYASGQPTEDGFAPIYEIPAG